MKSRHLRRLAMFGVATIALFSLSGCFHIEDCVGFNPGNATTQQIGGSWKIVDGNHWMFDFGSNETEAKQSLKIIKYYKMDDSCFVGRPDPSFKYLLVEKSAPVGSMSGEDCVAFNPATISVQQVAGSWKIVDGSHWIYDFATKEDEAKQSFKIIKKHGFNRACYVGRPDPSFEYLRK